MKAAIFKGPEKLIIEQINKPICDPDGIIVRIEACGICGSDIRNYHTGLKVDVPEQILGHEIAGVVEEAGKNVTKFKVGQRVAIAPDVSCGECYYCQRGWVNLCANHQMIGTHWPGGFAQYLHLPGIILKRGMVHPIPEGVSFEEAIISEPASSVLAAQERSHITLGDTVVIIGDGPIGCLHVEIARARGASQVILVGLGQKRLAMARQFGPTHIIDAAEQNPVEVVLGITGGLGADVVILANPVAQTHEQGIEMARKRGQIILFGGLSRTNPWSTVNANLIHYHELSLTGAFSYTPFHHQQALKFIAEGKIQAKKYITRVVPLEQIHEGIALMEKREVLKVVVKPWQG